MAAQEKIVSELSQVARASLGDLSVVCVANTSVANTYLTSLIPVGSVPSGNTPANSAATVIGAGSSWTDGNYFYVATSNNVVKRVALASF